MHITFYGAAREVTGSCSLVEANGLKILVDCGMYQGSDFNEGRNLDPLPFNPKELNAVLVTHAHLDHIGRLPLLIKGGYAGHFYATGPTMELAQLILEDAYHVMLYDNKKFGRPILYDEPDIAAVMAQFKAVEYGEELKLSRSAPLIMAQIATPQTVTAAAALHKSEESVSISPPFKKEGVGGRSRYVGRVVGYMRAVPFRRKLRREQTRAEKILWAELANKRLGGLKFRKQHGIGSYIVDFFQSDSRIIVEVDGDVHFALDDQVVKDSERQKWLEDHGYKIIRFNNVDVINNLRWVLEDIYNIVTTELQAMNRLPSSQRGEDKRGGFAVESERDPLPASPFLKGGVANRVPSFQKGGETGEVSIRFHDVGHILGSAFIEIVADGKRVVFSGDIGNHDAPIIRDTALLPPDIDALVCESTYGDRIHESSAERQAILEREVLTAIKRGGVLMIPSFALERTQELIYELNELIDRKHKLPRVPIFLDSPLAIGALQVYRKYHQYYDEEAMRLFKGGDDLFQFPGFEFTETTEASKRINQVPPPKIIIAGAGMMNGGRILHHALRYLSDPNSTLLIVGYQAKGTLGREILDGKATVNVMGERVHVRCSVRAIGALSAHADQEKLLDWIGGSGATPKKVYLNHGEPPASEALAKRLTNDLNIKATAVNFGLKVEV